MEFIILSGIHNTAPPSDQISLDLSVYQNPVSELYVRPSLHHCVLWLTEPQFPHCLAAFQSTRPSQSLTTKGSVRPWKGNSSLLSLGSSSISIGDSLDPSSMLIGFSGVPGTGIGGGGGEGDWNGGRIGTSCSSTVIPLEMHLESSRFFCLQNIVKEHCSPCLLFLYFTFHPSYCRMDVVNG